LVSVISRWSAAYGAGFVARPGQ